MAEDAESKIAVRCVKENDKRISTANLFAKQILNRIAFIGLLQGSASVIPVNTKVVVKKK